MYLSEHISFRKVSLSSKFLITLTDEKNAIKDSTAFSGQLAVFNLFLAVSNIPFLYHWKHLKIRGFLIRGFLMFSGGIVREHLHKMNLMQLKNSVGGHSIQVFHTWHRRVVLAFFQYFLDHLGRLYGFLNFYKGKLETSC